MNCLSAIVPTSRSASGPCSGSSCGPPSPRDEAGAEQPRLLTTEAVNDSDVVITMGCGDACPVFPGKRQEDWQLDEPAGRDVAAVRLIRDEIKARVVVLLRGLQEDRNER